MILFLRLHSIKLYLFAVTGYVSQCIVKPVGRGLFELKSEVFQSRAFEFLVELISSLTTDITYKVETNYVPILGVSFTVGIFHKLIIVEHSFPAL